MTRGGGFAEEVVVRDGAALRLPPGTDVAAAAGVHPACLHSGIRDTEVLGNLLDAVVCGPSVLRVLSHRNPFARG